MWVIAAALVGLCLPDNSQYRSRSLEEVLARGSRSPRLGKLEFGSETYSGVLEDIPT
jgi:hypothetical protein